MSTANTMTPAGAQIAVAILRGEVEEALELLRIHPQEQIGRSHIAGGTPLHVAAGKGNFDLVQGMVELGMEINSPSSLEGEFPIVRASSSAHPQVVAYLLSKGAVLDVSKSARNPLFAAISGQCFEIAKMLLVAGIDSAARYDTATMRGMDAMAFAVMHGQTETARLIACRELDGEDAIEAALIEARNIAELNTRMG